jgi:hypothetical protein
VRRGGAIALGLTALLVACRSSLPGHLAAVSVKAVATPMTVIAENAEGNACGSDTQQNIPAAIDDALTRFPEADALVNLSVFKEPRCIRVRGTAVRLGDVP